MTVSQTAGGGVTHEHRMICMLKSSYLHMRVHFRLYEGLKRVQLFKTDHDYDNASWKEMWSFPVLLKTKCVSKHKWMYPSVRARNYSG